MKTIPPASSAPSSSATAMPPAAARSAAAPRVATPLDYRANIERQSREQKSVGSVLSYVVYALIGLFVVGSSLAGYGAYVLAQRIHDQSVTVSDLDQRYAAANKDLSARLATMQDRLSQAQGQVNRQQELILRQQDAINKLIASTADTANGLKLEKQARTQEAATLRYRVREIENRPSAPATTTANTH